MYSSNSNGRPNSWAPHDEHSRGRVPAMWTPPDDRFRPRDDPMMQHPHAERQPIVPSDMPHHQHPQQGEMYHQMMPQHADPYSMQQPLYAQPAPRQRTAIACRYCRRRKIRCSGFDSSADGRCSNCLRFNQECVFTPVSAQTQAFVPAHTKYPHLQQGYIPARGDTRPYQQLYGVHGQPLPMSQSQHPDQMGYMHPHPGYGRPPSPGPSQPQYSRSYEDAAQYELERNRDFHQASLPPLGQPNQYTNHPSHLPPQPQRRGSAGDYPPGGWRSLPGNPPSPPPLPLLHPFSPPRTNGTFSSSSFPASSASPQARGSYPASEGRAYPGVPGSQTQLPPSSLAPRRSSDPRDNDTRESRIKSEFSTEPIPLYHPQGSATSAVQQPPAPVQRSSSAGASNPSNPMHLGNIIDTTSRSAADHKMLSSLNWKP